MAMLTIRNIDDSVKKQLRVRAAEHGCSMEEEVRRILQQALKSSTSKKGLGSRIHKAVMAVSGPVDLVLPPRSLPRATPDFSGDAS
jgi:plasmid stability protein